MTFWEGFKLGALAGIIYNAFKHPGGCACCALLLLLMAFVLVFLLVAFIVAIWDWLLAGAILLGLAVIARELWRKRSI